MKTNWSSKLRSTARHPLGDALEGVLSGLVALEARVALNPLRAGLGVARLHGAAVDARGSAREQNHVGRLREVLDRDRALVAAGAPLPSPAQIQPLAIVPGPVTAPRAPAPAGAFATPEPVPPTSAADLVVTARESARRQDQEAPPHPAAKSEGEEPIRTRTMARLLATQGHRARALAIYDALLAADPDPSLRAEAERLRSQAT